MAELIYQAGFDEAFHDPDTGLHLPALRPVFGDLGPLQLIQAPEPFLVGEPEERMSFLESPAGLRFTLLRDFLPADAPPSGQEGSIRDDCYVGAVVNPFPGDIEYFKIRATFELPRLKIDPSADYGWAVTIFARTGEVTDWPTRDQRTTVTLRSFTKDGKRLAMLNNPGGTPVFDRLIPDKLFACLFKSDDPKRSRFTLELLVDRIAKDARAGLDSRIYKQIDRDLAPLDTSVPYSQRRRFNHALLTDSGSIDCVGFAIGIGKALDSTGSATIATASATIRDFRIYRLNIADIWLARFYARLAKWLGLQPRG